MKEKEREISKRLSYVLRHAPESIGIELEAAGWVDVDQLLSQLAKHRRPVDRELLERVVANNSKQRFEFSEDEQKIRARQGHSVDIDLDYIAKSPPDVLYHGTADRFLDSILEQGLNKKGRHHVHLSTNRKTMRQVGSRHGKAVLIRIDAAGMNSAGFEFFLTGNDVWLTDHVPVEYLSVETNSSPKQE